MCELDQRRDVQVDDLTVGIEVTLRERTARSHAGAVHEEVHRPVGVGETGDDLSHRGRVGQIGDEGVNLTPTWSGEPGDQFVESVSAASHDRQVDAGDGELSCDGRANAAGCSGDEGGVPGMLHRLRLNRAGSAPGRWSKRLVRDSGIRRRHPTHVTFNPRHIRRPE